MRTLAFPFLLTCALGLGGCAASIAASALGAAARAAQSERAPVDAQAATDACTAHASHYGQVAVIDAEQRSPGKVTVWGTVGTGPERRSFQCGYTGRVSGFKLRTIQQR